MVFRRHRGGEGLGPHGGVLLLASADGVLELAQPPLQEVDRVADLFALLLEALYIIPFEGVDAVRDRLEQLEELKDLPVLHAEVVQTRSLRFGHH